MKCKHKDGWVIQESDNAISEESDERNRYKAIGVKMISEDLFRLEEKEFDEQIESMNTNQLKRTLCFAYGYMYSQMHEGKHTWKKKK